MVLSATFTSDTNRASIAARDTSASHAQASVEIGRLGGRPVIASLVESIRASALALLERVADAAQSVARPVSQAFRTVSEQIRNVMTIFSQDVPKRAAGIDATSKHTLTVARDMCNHLLSKIDDTRVTSGLFRVPPAPAALAAQKEEIIHGKCPNLSQTNPRVCASIVSTVIRELASVSLNDVRAAAAQTLNLAPDCPIATIAATLPGLDREQRSGFDDALVARMHANMEKSLRGDQNALAIAKEVLQSLSAIYNAAPTDTGRDFSQTTMKISFNLVRDEPAGDVITFMKGVEASQPMIWAAIASLQEPEITHL